MEGSEGSSPDFMKKVDSGKLVGAIVQRLIG
jgi:hypothetical protein